MNKRLALIIPHTDITLETDLQNYIPKDVILHTHRIWLDEVGEEAEKQMVQDALPKGIQYLKGNARYEASIFGCTSASAVFGQEGLIRLERMLSDELQCSSISAFGAVLKSIEDSARDLKKTLSSLRVGLITPYTETVNDFMVKSLGAFDVKVNISFGLGLSDDRDISKVPPNQIMDFVEKNSKALKENCDLVFMSCTNMRALEVREDVESLLGICTITSNYSIITWLTSILE